LPSFIVLNTDVKILVLYNRTPDMTSQSIVIHSEGLTTKTNMRTLLLEHPNRLSDTRGSSVFLSVKQKRYKIINPSLNPTA